MSTETAPLRYIPASTPCPPWCDKDGCEEYVALDESAELPERMHGYAGQEMLVGRGADDVVKIDVWVTEKLHPDSSVTWSGGGIFLGNTQPVLTPDEARQVAAELVRAADRVNSTVTPTSTSMARLSLDQVDNSGLMGPEDVAADMFGGVA